MQKINSSYQITAQNFLISLECLIWLCPANTFSVANTNAQTSGHPHIPYNLYPYTIYKARTNSPSHLAASTHINTNTKPYTQHWWYKVRARNRCARSAKKPIINVYYGFSSAMHSLYDDDDDDDGFTISIEFPVLNNTTRLWCTNAFICAATNCNSRITHTPKKPRNSNAYIDTICCCDLISSCSAAGWSENSASIVDSHTYSCCETGPRLGGFVYRAWSLEPGRVYT